MYNFAERIIQKEGDELKPKLVFRLSIDLLMTLFMFLAMAYPITGNKMHEIIGVILFCLFTIHNYMNRRWYKTIFRGKFNIQRIIGNIVNFLFLVSITIVLLSSIPISRDVLVFLPLEDTMLMREIHVLAAYWGFIGMGFHIGISWTMVMIAARRMTGITELKRSRTFAIRILAAIIVLYGVKASFGRDFGSKLLIYDPFGLFVSNNRSMLLHIIDYLSIVGIYIFGTHYTVELPKKEPKSLINCN